MKSYLQATFSSLAHRNYRLYFVGQSVSVTGTWMQKVAQVWLVLQLTGSGALLGLTAALQAAPTLLLTPWGGLLADRFSKRRILLCTQAAGAVPALALGILTSSGAIATWMVLVLATMTGCVEALDKPSRLTFVSEIVGPDHITNAVTLNNTVQNVGKVVGPAVGGVTIAAVGVTASFFINAASFGAVLVGLALMNTDRLHLGAPVARTKGQLREGVRYVHHRPDLLGPLLLMTITGLLAYNWTVVLPLLVTDVFHGGPEAVGLAFTAMGTGAVLGGLSVAGSLRTSPARLGASGLLLSFVMVVLALAPNLLVALVVLFALGGSSVTLRASATSLLQLRADPSMRGRVVSLLVLATGGTTPLGGPLVGWISEVSSPRLALGGAALSTAAVSVWAVLYARRTSVPSRDRTSVEAVPSAVVP